MTNKQTTKCIECGGEGELECQGDSHYIDTMSSHDCFNETCEECDGTGTTETKFSDFIRNSTEEEATEVFTDIMKGVAEDQKVILKKTLEERFEEFWYNSEKNDDYGVLARLKDGDDPDYLIKDFIKNEIALAVQQERERITSKIENSIENFAHTEHVRWAKWQNYLHSFLIWNGSSWELPHEKKERWQRQIETPYLMLSEKEKESDREQVRPYINFIIKAINQDHE